MEAFAGQLGGTEHYFVAGCAGVALGGVVEVVPPEEAACVLDDLFVGLLCGCACGCVKVYE